jgi:hypothetical protein
VLSEEWDYVAVLGSGTAKNVDPQPTRKKMQMMAGQMEMAGMSSRQPRVD